MIEPRYYGLIELSFSGAVALGIGIWQYLSVSRSIAADKAKRLAQPPDASPEGAGHTIGEHRLDDR